MFEAVTKATEEAAEQTTKANELKVDETKKTLYEMKDSTNSFDDIIKNARQYDVWPSEPLAKLFIWTNQSHFRLRVNPSSPEDFLINDLLVAFHGRMLAFTETKKV